MIGRAWLFLALAAFPALANAQRITGIIRDTSSAQPISGVVISVLDSASRTVARGISGDEGRYSVELPRVARQLRIVRIGYQPRSITLPPHDANLALDFAMSKVGTLLSARFVNDERICATDRDRRDALSLWEQARAGLLASIVAREAQPAVAMVLRYDRIMDRTGLVLTQKASLSTGVTTHPFVAADAPAALAEKGYVDEGPDGRKFKAPDADVLLDDSFAQTHCFSVQQADPGHLGAIGLAFEPAKGREKLMDVRGTLWMEVGTPALRTLEYRYTGGDEAWERAGASGFIHFRTMSNGVTFVDEWKLRLPVMERTGGIVATNRNGVLGRQGGKLQPSGNGQMGVGGGFVLSATWANELHWQSELRPLLGIIQENVTHAPRVGALVVVPATGDTIVTDSSGRFQLTPFVPGKYAISVIDTTLGSYIAPRFWDFQTTVDASEPPLEPVAMPSLPEVARKVCGPTPEGKLVAMIAGRVRHFAGESPLPADTRVVAAWVQEHNMSLQETQTVSLDQQGRFSVCGIPREDIVHLSLQRENTFFADTAMQMPIDSALNILDWRIDARALATLAPVKPGTLLGHVTRGTTGEVVAGADVWLPEADRHATTDAAGAYRIDNLVPGRIFMQVRSVGVSPYRMSVPVAPGAQTVHDVALGASVQMLDTVRTTASAQKYISPGLRGFEDRRAHSPSGYFLPDSVLRKEGDKALASVLLSRVSGVQLVPGSMGALYMASSRKQCSGPVIMSACSVPNCFVTVYLDGALYYSGAPGVPPPDAGRLQIRDLGAVEFYPGSGTGPAEYNATGNGCGTLLMWSRER